MRRRDGAPSPSAARRALEDLADRRDRAGLVGREHGDAAIENFSTCRSDGRLAFRL
jgi:hypothetical protein